MNGLLLNGDTGYRTVRSPPRKAEGGRLRGDAFTLEPCIPSAWDGFELTYRYRSTSYRIRVENPDHPQGGVAEVRLDGQAVTGGEVPLTDDGQVHEVRVRLG